MCANYALQPRRPVVLDDLRACALQQASVGHTRWTSRLAIQAAEAAINMGDERLAQREPALVHLHHLVNAAAGRIHLRAQHSIGRALVQAQPAVDTLGVQVPRRLLTRGEIRYWLFRNWSSRGQNRNLPRFRMSLGSSASFTARMLPRPAGSGPHAVTWSRASVGQWRTAMLTSRGKRLRNSEMALTKFAGVTSPCAAGHIAASK